MNTPLTTEVLLEELHREMGNAPQVFQYDDYRRYLCDYYAYEKKRSPIFSLRYFSRRAGYRSGSFFKMVMGGQRNLTDDGIDNFSRALKFSPGEAEFFRHLVHFNQSQSSEQKQRFAYEMMRSKTFQSLRPLVKAKFEYWSRWYNVVIRELIPLSGFREDPQWIAQVLNPRITPDQAASSLEQLLALGLIARGADGRLHVTDGDITSGDETVHVALSQFHRDMIQRAREAIDRFAKADRLIVGLTISVNDAGHERAKEILQTCRKELLALGNQGDNANRVLQLNLQMFPLTDEVKS